MAVTIFFKMPLVGTLSVQIGTTIEFFLTRVPRVIMELSGNPEVVGSFSSVLKQYATLNKQLCVPN
jgi:hypothetical protein